MVKKQKKINCFKRIVFSIIGKKYTEMIDSGSWYAIAYLGIPELLFSVLISVFATIKMLDSTLVEIYQYGKSFLFMFFWNSISLTFDSILLLTLITFLIEKLRKKDISYSRFFCLATYASTLPMIIKYIIFTISYIHDYNNGWLRFIYIGILLIYYFTNYKSVFQNNNKSNKKVVELK